MTALARPLVAESIKLRRGSLPRLPLFGLLAALLEGTLFLISPYALHSWTALSAWHIVWVTFLSPLALALLAGLGAQREAHARWGGTLWRPVTPVALAGAQFLGLAALAFAMDLCVILGSLPFGVVARLPGAAPVAHGLALAIILWITSLPLLALFQLIATRWGLIPTMLAGLMGAILGVLPAESDLWMLAPPAWPVRATLTLLGTHANGLPLEADSPLWRISPWPALLLALAVTPLLVRLAARGVIVEPGARSLRRRRRALTAEARLGAFQIVSSASATQLDATRTATSGRFGASAFAAEMVKQRHSLLPWIAVLGPLLSVGIASLLHYPTTYVLQGWALVVTPFVMALLPVRAWLWERVSWRALCARPTSPARLYVAKLAALWVWVALSVTLFCMGLLIFGAPIETVASFWMLNISVALPLLALHLLLAARIGVGVSLGAGAFGTILALLLGGTELDAALWPIVPWTWSWLAYASGLSFVYASVALILGGSLALIGAWAAERPR